jgi:Na+-transporting methylmalonyl-CoA/oxaloacetate decarboxylase gamma subunit
MLSKSISSQTLILSNVALLTFEGAAFNVTFLALLLILVYPLIMVLKQQ